MLSYDQAKDVAPHTSSPNVPSKRMDSSTSRTSNGTGHRKTHHIWIITGPAGCGKSTVGTFVANQLSLPYIEGDDFHPKANLEKMEQGIPLTDADRWDWLILLRQQSMNAISKGARGVVMTCSALKQKYRDVIRIASYNDHHVSVHFVYLRATEELLRARVRARQGHFMKDDMVKSQFNALEEPGADEPDCLIVDVRGSLPEVEALALATIKLALESEAEASQ